MIDEPKNIPLLGLSIRKDAAPDPPMSISPPGMKRHVPLAAMLLLGFLVFTAFFSLKAYVPLTHDEAWNFLWLSWLSPDWVLTHYPAPNNHIFFTLLQALFLPNRLIFAHPPALRTVNLVVGFLTTLFLSILICSKSGASPIRSTMISFCLVFCSPLLTIYFFVARGYLTGTALLLLACVCLARNIGGNKGLLSSLFVVSFLSSLSVLTVPTFAYAFPGLVAAWALLRVRQASAGAVLTSLVGLAGSFLILSGLFYISTFKDMLTFQHKPLLPVNRSLGIFLDQFFRQTTNFLHPAAGVLLLAGATGFALWAWRRRDSRNGELALILVSAVYSFFILTILQFLRGVSLPYPRNAVFVPLFLGIAVLLLSVGAPRPATSTVTGFLIANAIIGVLLFFKAFLIGVPIDYPDFNATPLDRLDLRQIRKLEMIVYEANSGPIAKLYAVSAGVPSIEARHIHPAECSYGKVIPPETWRVALVVDHKPLLACF